MRYMCSRPVRLWPMAVGRSVGRFLARHRQETRVALSMLLSELGDDGIQVSQVHLSFIFISISSLLLHFKHI